MPKNVLFLLNIVKIIKRWGLCLQTPLASGGWGLRSQNPTSVFLHCEFFSLHLLTKHKLFRNQPKKLIFL